MLKSSMGTKKTIIRNQTTISKAKREEIKSLEAEAKMYLKLQYKAAKAMKFDEFQELGKKYSTTIRKIEDVKIRCSSSDKREYAKEYHLPPMK